ncbi:hypothetical protein RRG08_020020 [Elysia crispata]|uniref:Uncharacterized protein n=1 Tax=Elysia crispata TaxID=231223 RepID=A0AAE1ECV0_9GAST|nr:hypothetical protein RRG08_020020 [Elysia crispata]
MSSMRQPCLRNLMSCSRNQSEPSLCVEAIPVERKHWGMTANSKQDDEKLAVWLLRRIESVATVWSGVSKPWPAGHIWSAT